MGHTYFHTSLHLLAQQHVGWANLGILSLTPTPTPPHTTSHPTALLRLCFRNHPAGSANQSARCPHLLRTATICLTLWVEAVSSDPGLRPPYTTMLPRPFCKLQWHHQAKGTLEVLTQSKKIPNTHSQPHTHLHTNIIKPVGFGGAWAYMRLAVCFYLIAQL